MFALAVCCFFYNSSQAQGGYVLVDYMKIKPGMYDKAMECEKIWKEIHMNRKQQGKITGWHIEEMIVPGGTSSEYDYLAVTFVKNWDDIGHLWDNWAAEQKALPADKKAIVEKTDTYRDRVKSEIWREQDGIFKKDFKGAKYVVENFFKVPANGWDDYLEMETRFVKPVHQKNIDMGNRAGWVLGFVVAPQGSDMPYDCSTVDLFDKWEDIDNEQDGKAWEAIYPGMSNAHIGHRIESTRTLVRTEIREVVQATD